MANKKFGSNIIVQYGGLEDEGLLPPEVEECGERKYSLAGIYRKTITIRMKTNRANQYKRIISVQCIVDKYIARSDSNNLLYKAGLTIK